MILSQSLESMMRLSRIKVAIIGAGPAGMAAALQLQRFGIETILLGADLPGSLLKNAWLVENYLGITPGMSGQDLLRVFQQHLKQNKITVINTAVKILDYAVTEQLFTIKTATKNYEADYVVVATGTKPKVLPLMTTVQDARKKYVFSEVFPLLKKRKRTIVIIGAGDAAFDNALNLAKYNKVIICGRGKNLSALPLLVQQAVKNQHITCYQDHELHSILAGSQKNLTCKFVNKESQMSLDTDYLLIAIGRTPQKDFYTDRLQSWEKQLLKCHKLFLAGDIKNAIYRQVAIAVSDGIVAAMQIFYAFQGRKFIEVKKK